MKNTLLICLAIVLTITTSVLLVAAQQTTPAKPDRNESMRLARSGNALYEAAAGLDEKLPMATRQASFKKALDELDKAVAADPAFAIPLRVRSLVYLYAPGTDLQQRTSAELALKDADLAITLDPKSPFGYKCRADIEVAKAKRLKEQPKNFMADFTQKTFGQTKDPVYVDDRGRTRSQLLDLAVADYSTAISFTPTASFYGDRAEAYRFNGNFEKAKADYAEAFRLDPTFVEAKRMLDAVTNLAGASKPVTPPPAASATALTGDWALDATMNGRPLMMNAHFEKKGTLWAGTVTNTMGNSLPLMDLVISPDRRFSFKLIFPNGMTQTYKGTVDAAYQTLSGECNTLFGAQTLPGTVNGKRKPQ